MEARGKSTGSELELSGALPTCLAPGAEPALTCLRVGWIRRYFPLQKKERSAFHSHGVCHLQPSALSKIVDHVGSCSHPASFERKDFSFLVSSENEGPGRLERVAEGHVSGGSNTVSVYFRTLCRHCLCLQLCRHLLVVIITCWFARAQMWKLRLSSHGSPSFSVISRSCWPKFSHTDWWSKLFKRYWLSHHDTKWRLKCVLHQSFSG